VNEVVPAAHLMSAAHDWAKRLCRLSPLCNGLTKRALHHAQQSHLEAAIAYEADLQQVAARSADCREGIDAFINKRPAEFPGR
jgi:enoyl-CoA hydratase/carnithine racemase